MQLSQGTASGLNMVGLVAARLGEAGTLTNVLPFAHVIKRVAGTAANPTLYFYGIEDWGATGDSDDDNRPYTLEIKLDAFGGTNEWTKTYTDPAGRIYKTIYADATPDDLSDNPYEKTWFNNKGQPWKQRDPDGVTTFTTYNPKGEQAYSITAMSDTTAGISDYGTLLSSLSSLLLGSDRISFVTNDFFHDSVLGDLRRTRTYIWPANGSNLSLLASTALTSVDGLHSLQISFCLTNESVTVFGSNGYRFTTNWAPDRSYSVSISRYGTNVSSSHFDAINNQLSSINYLQDAHGRPAVTIDARNGGTTNWFNNADLISGIKTPVPGPGQSAEVTSNFYDTSLRLIATKLPDSTYVTNAANQNGQVALSYGSRTYATGNGFDAQGRQQTLTNWSTFPSAGARATTWNYNAYRGWLDNKRYPDNTGPSYAYSAAGRMTNRVWARGIASTNDLNLAGEISGTTYNDGVTAALISIFDRQTREATNLQGSITISRSFTDAGSVASENYSGGPLGGLTVSNRFDQLLRRTNLLLKSQIANLKSTSFSLDVASRLSTVSDGTNSATYAYLANSPLIGQVSYYNNGVLRMTRSNQVDNLNRLTNLVWKVSSTVIASFGYQYNNANQRTRLTLLDGSYWLFGYDSLGQLNSGKHYWSDGSPVAGQQFEYGFDDIGNRTVTRSGGDQYNGSYLRSANYANNLLNQITSRDVPGYLDVFGSANSNAAISLWTPDGYWAQTTRHGNWYRGELAVNNSTGALWLTITNLAVLPNGSSADIVTNSVGRAFVPRAPQQFYYDLDGNLTNDGRFAIAWDAENRATSFMSLTSTPAASRVKVDCTYDSQWRRTQKIVSTWNQSTLNYQPSTTNKFVYDGWNLIAILNHTNEVLYSFTWGTDLSGTEQGAGGIGGLISMRVHSGPLAGTYFYVFDGNGNVMMLINAADGSIAAQYEYSAFGELLRASGPLAQTNPFRFSTKFQDDESGFVYYGYRYYDPSAGRWLSRDPAEEDAGSANLYVFVANDPAASSDVLGLSAADDFKYIGYRFWRRNFVKAPQWREVMDNWFYETGPDAPYYSGNGDPRNIDIMKNRGFQHLLNCWVAKRRGEQIRQSSEWEVRDDGFWWHYGYWGFLGLETSAGGSAAYTSATHLLGSYDTKLTPLGGSPDAVLADVYNNSHWVSGTRTEGIPFVGWLIKRFGTGAASLFADHPRRAGPESPSSRGGDMPQHYMFVVIVDPCAQCVLP